MACRGNPVRWGGAPPAAQTVRLTLHTASAVVCAQAARAVAGWACMGEGLGGAAHCLAPRSGVAHRHLLCADVSARQRGAAAARRA